MRFWASASAIALLADSGTCFAQAPTAKASLGKAAAKRANELTLAGLRPGRGRQERIAQRKWEVSHKQELPQLYGEPDSRSPSTKGGESLELWYYALIGRVRICP